MATYGLLPFSFGKSDVYFSRIFIFYVSLGKWESADISIFLQILKVWLGSSAFLVTVLNSNIFFLCIGAVI